MYNISPKCNARLCQLHSVALVSFTSDRKEFSQRMPLTQGLLAGPKPTVLSNCRNEALANGKLACRMKTEIPEGSL